MFKHSWAQHRLGLVPFSVDIWGGFMIDQLQFQKHSMRFNIMEANQVAANTAASFGFDV
jgi:hypothetical protein